VKFEVAFTGDVTDEEHAREGATRENGWIDPKWSMTVLHENREDVRTETFDTLGEAVAFIEDTIGSVNDNGDGTYYAQDGHMDLQTGDDWSYAGHITELP
jgi:hypothetical protein